MAFPVNFYACKTDPNSIECKRTTKFFRDLLEAQYLARFLNRPVFPPPFSPPDLGGVAADPSPQPSIAATIESQNNLLSELLMNALDPTPQTNMPTLVREIQSSGIQLEVVKSLLQQFETAIVVLKEEEKRLKADCCC